MPQSFSVGEATAPFRSGLIEWLRHNEPTAGPPLQPATLAGMVEVGIARARQAGITEDPAVAGFVVLMFSLSPNFDEHPVLHQVLQDTSLTQLQRVEKMADSPRALRIEVAGQSRLSAWFE